MLKQTLKRTKCQNINVLVTSGSLIPSLVKCLLYQLDDVIPANNGMLSLSSIVFFPCFCLNMGMSMKLCSLAQKVRIKGTMEKGKMFRK